VNASSDASTCPKRRSCAHARAADLQPFLTRTHDTALDFDVAPELRELQERIRAFIAN
jgi:hypothetical protein